MTETETALIFPHLLAFVDGQKDKISKLCSEMKERAIEPNSEKIREIKNNICDVISAVSSFSDRDDNILTILKNKAHAIDILINCAIRKENIDKRTWVNITHRLDDFCLEASSWSPLNPNMLKKGSKIIINLNLPKNINIASIIGNQSTK